MTNIQIITTKKGRKTIANTNFSEGDVVLKITGKETLLRDKYTIQFKKSLHISPSTYAGKYINHSCSPNTKVSLEREFIALSPIKKGEEITFDYETTEDEIAEKFDCLCGSENCRGRINGRVA